MPDEADDDAHGDLSRDTGVLEEDEQKGHQECNHAARDNLARDLSQ